MTIEIGPKTAEELLRMPDDGSRYELVRGELRRMAPAGNRHGYIAGEIFTELRNYVKANDLGRTYAAETGFKVATNPDTGSHPTRLSSAGNGSIRPARRKATGPAPQTWPWRSSPRTTPTRKW